MALLWFSAGDFKHFGRFRYEEVESLAVLYNLPHPWYIEKSDDMECPYTIINLDLGNEEIARNMAKRFILTQGIYEIWSSGNSIEQCLEHARKLANDPKMQKYFSPDLKFCARVRAYGKKFQTAEKLEIIHTFIANLPFKAKVDLDNPDFEIWILMDYGMAENKPDQPLKRVFFTRRICKSAREELLDDYALNKRKYIGTTSTKAELAFLMANQALVKPGSLVYDPFVGTGSIIISCAVFGALVYGSDIDIRVLKGNDLNLLDNFKQYNLKRPELLRADSSRPNWRNELRFDSIVCDPPYGIREGARKTGTTKEIKHVSEDMLDSYITRTQQYDVGDLMADLLDFAAKTLFLNGRLVYLLPTNEEYSESDLPQHPCLKLVANSEQYLSRKLKRRLITMEKIQEYQTGLRTIPYLQTPSHARVRDQFINNRAEKKSKD